jgi:hypothetical protein
MELSLAADLDVRQQHNRYKRWKGENSDVEWSTPCCQQDCRRTEYSYSLYDWFWRMIWDESFWLKLVSKNLINDQPHHRVEVSSDLFQRIRRMTSCWTESSRACKLGLSAWIWDKAVEHAVEIASLTSPQGSAHVKIKSQDSVALFKKEVVHQIFSHLSRLNQKFYLRVFGRLRQRVRLMRPKLFSDEWILYSDKGSAHTALPGKGFSRKKSVFVLEPPIYSPDLLLTSASSHPRRIIWKEHILKLWKRFRKLLRRPLWTACKRMSAELLRELEATQEFMCCCRRELIWRRPRKLAIQFTSNTVPSARIQSLYLIYRPRTVREGIET